MIFVDTNVLLDLLEDASTPEGEWSRRSLKREAALNPLITNLVVAAELAGQVVDVAALGQSLIDADIGLVDLDLATAYRAGAAFRLYRQRGGRRAAILPDFLIGAHAVFLGATLLTRDRGLASYFPDLTLITPDTHP